MKNIFLLTTIFFILILVSCDDRYSTDHHPTLVWVYGDSSGCCYKQIHFLNYKFQNTKKIEYRVNEDIAGPYGAIGIFEFNDNIKPFSEWNECSIKFPVDTTKKWLFRFEGKNTPENISVLYDIKNPSNDTLVFWDSVSNIKYNFTKRIMPSV